MAARVQVAEGNLAVRTAMVLFMFGIFFTGLIVLFKMIPKVRNPASPKIHLK